MARLTQVPICGAWFSFRGDQECLEQSVRAFRRVYGRDVPICVFDDQADPMEEDFVASLSPSLYVLTTWERKGNLNGRECVLGILNCLALACATTRARYVAKVDCDTILFRPWADLESAIAFQGIFWWPRALATGCFYVFRADAPEKLLSWMLVRRVLDGDGVFEEDRTISFYSAVVFPRGVVIRHDGCGAKRRIAGGWIYSPKTSKLSDFAEDYCIANFGDRHQMPDDWDNVRKRREVAATMVSFNDWVDAGCPREVGGKAAAPAPGGEYTVLKKRDSPAFQQGNF